MTCHGNMRQNANKSATDQGSGIPGSPNIRIFEPETRGGPCADLPWSYGIIFSPKFQHPTILVNHFHICLYLVFFKKKTWKYNFSGIPWTLGSSGPPLGARAPNSIQDSLNESSVRPNGTPVMPVLRSRSTVKKTVRKKLSLVATKDTVRIKGKSQLVLFVSDSNTNRIRWNFPFIRTVLCSQ